MSAELEPGYYGDEGTVIGDYNPAAAGDAYDNDPTQAQVTELNVKAATAVGTVMLAFPPWGTVAGAIVIGVAALVGLLNKKFGNNWHTSTHVRWLLVAYQYYVLGHANVRSNKDVDESLLEDCYKWFSGALGVPIYDDYRLHALTGQDNSTGKSMGWTYTERANYYLTFWDAQEQGVTFEAAYIAAQLADQLLVEGAGAWANTPLASSWLKYVTKTDVVAMQANELTNDVLLNPPSVLRTVKEYGLYILGAIALAGVGLAVAGSRRNRKK